MNPPDVTPDDASRVWEIVSSRINHDEARVRRRTRRTRASAAVLVAAAIGVLSVGVASGASWAPFGFGRGPAAEHLAGVKTTSAPTASPATLERFREYAQMRTKQKRLASGVAVEPEDVRMLATEGDYGVAGAVIGSAGCYSVQHDGRPLGITCSDQLSENGITYALEVRGMTSGNEYVLAGLYADGVSDVHLTVNDGSQVAPVQFSNNGFIWVSKTAPTTLEVEYNGSTRSIALPQAEDRTPPPGIADQPRHRP